MRRPHATINYNFSNVGLKRERPDAASVARTFRIVPPSIAQSDNDKQRSGRDDRGDRNNLHYFGGVCLEREGAKRREWGTTSASTRRGSESEDRSARSAMTTKQYYRDDRARRELAICGDRNATINLILGALASGGSARAQFGSGINRTR